VARQQRDSVNLPAELAEELRRLAAESDLTPDELAADLIRAQLAAEEEPEPDLAVAIEIAVADLTEAVAFYQRLGAEVAHGSRDGDWVQLALGTARITLREADKNGETGGVQLGFESGEPLAAIVERLRDAGVTVLRAAKPDAYGSRLQVEGPDGEPVPISYLDPSPYA
jgi:catechol 2,3-dioxygenase-like lactoylglutathione lyase family enzyme